MRILAKTCAILAVCLWAAGGAKAVDFMQPFVMVSLPKEPLNLGEVCGPRLQQVEAQTTAHVVANCPYHMLVSFDGLRHQRSRIAISPKHLTATVNGMDVPIGTGRVPIFSQGPTSPSGVDVPIQLLVAVKATASYPAGRYGGTLMITITAGH